jgi:hypothetical protein
MKERIAVAKFLARSIMPAVSIVKNIGGDSGDAQTNAEALSRFDQIVEMAALRGNVQMPRKVREAEIVPEEVDLDE